MADIGPKPEEIKALTSQFYSTLRAYVAKIAPPESERAREAFDKIVELLAKSGPEESWNDAYAVEQLLIPLFDDATAKVELDIRVLEAQTALRRELAERYKTASTEVSGGDRKALLARLVNDLQWRYTVNEAKRGYSKMITRTTGLLFSGTLVVFFSVLLWVLIARQWFDMYNRLLLLPIVGLAGAWGAGFSMLTSVRSRLDGSELDDLKLMRYGSILTARLLTGFGAALILYFFVVSGLLGGAAFPEELAKPSDAPALRTVYGSEAEKAEPTAKALALLIVWSFIAGFSERLVPGLLAKHEEPPETTGGRPRTGERTEESPREGGPDAAKDKSAA